MAKTSKARAKSRVKSKGKKSDSASSAKAVRKPDPLKRCVAEVDLDVLVKNQKILISHAKQTYTSLKGSVPMVKANAYGHGLTEVAKAFEKQPTTLALGVATLDEAVALRQARVRKPIWVFSDLAPWTSEFAAACLKYKLSPVLHRLDDLRAFVKNPRLTKLEFHLKFNTGMNRLGMGMGALEEARALVRKAKAKKFGICTHFATADQPEHVLTRAQLHAFREVVRGFSSLNVSYIHGANTSAILNDYRLGMGEFCNVIRPGLGLYGYAGDEGERLGLAPALMLRARVLLSRGLSGDDYVGYGATYRAPGTGIAQAVLGVGYGDGFFRALSNHEIVVENLKTKVMGRVSMDMTSIEGMYPANDWVTLIGQSRQQTEALSVAAGTIVYEVLTNISARVPRVYR